MKNKRQCKHCHKFFDYRHVSRHEEICSKNPNHAQVIQGEVVDTLPLLDEQMLANKFCDGIWSQLTVTQKQLALASFFLSLVGE